MRSDEIKIGVVYYFNNREVLILGREGETDFFRCATKFGLHHDYDGREFCGHCLIGGGSNIPVMDCEAEIYQNALDSIVEEIENDKMNHDIIFVPSVYLQDQPFEYKENQNLSNKNKQLAQEINDKKIALKELNENFEAIKNQLIDLSKIKDSKQEEIDKINSEILNISNQAQELKKEIINNKPLIIENTNKTIPVNELLSLIESSITLEKLQSGGVDNWDWYGESVGEYEDIQKEALQQLMNI